MLNKIQFEDKVDLYEDSNTNRKNKVVADDMNEIKSVVNAIVDGMNNLFNVAFPIGTKIFNTGVNPGTYLGGTWVLDNPGAVSVCQDENDTDFDTVGKTGGEKTHTLTINEMPEHNHNMIYGTNTNKPGFGVTVAAGDGPYSSPAIIETKGGNQAHNNVQPYVVDCRWIKVSNTANDTQAIQAYIQSQAQINANNQRNTNDNKKSNGDDGEIKKEESK